MSLDHYFISEASTLGKILLKGDDSEIIGCADEILMFLNHLQDFIIQNPKSLIPPSSISDIIYGLESNPEITLRDTSIRARILNLFVKILQ